MNKLEINLTDFVYLEFRPDVKSVKSVKSSTPTAFFCMAVQVDTGFASHHGLCNISSTRRSALSDIRHTSISGLKPVAQPSFLKHSLRGFWISDKTLLPAFDIASLMIYNSLDIPIPAHIDKWVKTRGAAEFFKTHSSRFLDIR